MIIWEVRVFILEIVGVLLPENHIHKDEIQQKLINQFSNYTNVLE
jgi:hypothetical protein